MLNTMKNDGKTSYSPIINIQNVTMMQDFFKTKVGHICAKIIPMQSTQRQNMKMSTINLVYGGISRKDTSN